ncbi:hypothetical protein [Desulfosporosinus metallidurans]|uniref:hypothetical protein n=1 Tax=Desulfosporosinus metallidurans TaxID=1888891 RepID=UPI00094D09D2|nr:hypothetical protein [Desulfosporosinus metallidurans]
MDSLFLADLMDRNVKVLTYRPSFAEASELLSTYHLVLIQHNQPIEVLARDQKNLFLDSTHTHVSPTLLPWELPILAQSDTKAIPFYETTLVIYIP